MKNSTGRERFELRLDAEEAAWLRSMADEDGSSAADLLRRWIRREWREVEVRREHLQREHRSQQVEGLLGRLATLPHARTVAVFSGRDGALADPSFGASSHPSLAYHQVYQGAGLVIGQGFTMGLNDDEKRMVAQRFPGMDVAWRSTSFFDPHAYEALFRIARAHEKALLEAAVHEFDTHRGTLMGLEPEALMKLVGAGVAEMTARDVLKKLAMVGAVRQRVYDVYESNDDFLRYLDSRREQPS